MRKFLLLSLLSLGACAPKSIDMLAVRIERWQISLNAQSSASSGGQPRWNTNPALTASSQAAPTGTPYPEIPANPAKLNYGGQSSTVAGALHVRGCQSYQVFMCAVVSSGTQQTLSGAGTLQVYDFPEAVGAIVAGPGIALWHRNPGLDETVTVTATSCGGSACACQAFPAHNASGLDWIYLAPTSVTVSGGTTVNVLIEAQCRN